MQALSILPSIECPKHGVQLSQSNVWQASKQFVIVVTFRCTIDSATKPSDHKTLVVCCARRSIDKTHAGRNQIKKYLDCGSYRERAYEYIWKKIHDNFFGVCASLMGNVVWFSDELTLLLFGWCSQILVQLKYWNIFAVEAAVRQETVGIWDQVFSLSLLIRNQRCFILACTCCRCC